MRLLHLSDTHLGAELFVRGAPAGWRREHDHLEAMRLALEPAFRGEVDAVVHSGDLFDRSRPPPRVVVPAARLLGELARQLPVVLMNGNHDWRGLTRPFAVRPPGLTVIDRPSRVVLRGVALALVPYQPHPRRFASAAAHAWGPGADLLVCHQAFAGAQVPGFTFRPGAPLDTLGPEALPPGARHVLCGHIHPRQRIRVGEAEVVMPGSTERTAFSEADQVKGAAIWDLGREVRARFFDLPSRPMLRVTSPSDLGAVREGCLVRAEGVDEGLCLERGAFVVQRQGRASAPRSESTQAVLFGLAAGGALARE